MSWTWRFLLIFGSFWIADGCHHKHHGFHDKFKCGGPFLRDGFKCKNFESFKFFFGVCCGDRCIVPPEHNPCTSGPKSTAPKPTVPESTAPESTASESTVPTTPEPESTEATAPPSFCFDACDRPCVPRECGSKPTEDCRKRCVTKCASACGMDDKPGSRPQDPDQYKPNQL
ncbi:uncharacterized protein LOC144134282 [Amblyomma americanum]